MKTKKIVPLPFPFYFWPVVFIILLGIADSIYLSISHYRVYVDIGYRSFCAISKAINCDTVSQSPYSIFLNFPVPLWGVFGYLFLLLLIPFSATKSAKKQRAWPFVQLVSLIFCCYSIILALISTFYIHSYCIMCIASYAVNLLILFYAWIIRRRFAQQENFSQGIKRDIVFFVKIKRKEVIFTFLPLFLVMGASWLFIPDYWNFKTLPLEKDIPRGITDDLKPWIGSKNPILTIHEFADYQCFQCKKMHFYLRQLVAENPNKIRLIHGHFPMDSKYNPTVLAPYHEGSGKLALIAIHAMLKNKFWEANDILFEQNIKRDKGINTKKIANATGLDNRELYYVISNLNNKSDQYIQTLNLILQRDILQGVKHELSGTPGYIINGELYQGIIPPEIIRKALE